MVIENPLWKWLPAMVLLTLSATEAQAAIRIDTVPVLHPGNDPVGPPGSEYGRVDYVYRIGTYEVTARQYTAFLNAVAAMDTYGLYTTKMTTDLYGCKIERSGSPGTYTYSVDSDWADRPVNFVSWGDAARFANWLHNGQPTGAQDLTTTEDGAYFLNGATTQTQLMAVTRKPGSTWFIPSEDEWVKAAYYDGAANLYYWYPTSSDTEPSKDLLDPDPGNNATFFWGDYTIGYPYYRTEVGAHENSASPYGTFDQGGNVFEWNETGMYGTKRGLRGGSFSSYHAPGWMRRNSRGWWPPGVESEAAGFRVAAVIPEPVSALVWSALGVVGFVWWRRRK